MMAALVPSMALADLGNHRDHETAFYDTISSNLLAGLYQTPFGQMLEFYDATNHAIATTFFNASRFDANVISILDSRNIGNNHLVEVKSNNPGARCWATAAGDLYVEVGVLADGRSYRLYATDAGLHEIDELHARMKMAR